MARRRSTSPRDLMQVRGAALFGYARALAGTRADSALADALAVVYGARRPPAEVADAEPATVRALRRGSFKLPAARELTTASVLEGYSPGGRVPTTSHVLDGLTGPQRVCAVMRLLDDMTVDAIAEELGISPSLARQHAALGLEALNNLGGDLGSTVGESLDGGTETLVVLTKKYGPS